MARRPNPDDFAGTAALLAGALLLGCAGPEPPPEVPDRFTAVGDRVEIGAVLSSCSGWADTPLGRRCDALRRALPECRWVRLSCPVGRPCWISPEWECLDGEPPGEGFLWRLSGPLTEGGAISLEGVPAKPGSIVLRGRITGEELGGLRYLLPAAKGTGPYRLAPEDVLFRVRLRPEAGLNVARLVEAEGMAARLFRLRAELLTGVTLEGSVELALYLPTETRLPPLALALDHRGRGPAVRAMEAFIEELEQTWPLERSPVELRGWDGVCLEGLGVLPELAPCYVATDRALVVGWNRHSLERSLGGSTPSGIPPSVTGVWGGSAALSLDRIAEADRRMGGQRRYPWSLVVVRAGRVDGETRIEVEIREVAAP